MPTGNLCLQELLLVYFVGFITTTSPLRRGDRLSCLMNPHRISEYVHRKRPPGRLTLVTLYVYAQWLAMAQDISEKLPRSS
jgi:hypothetical protein